MPGWIDCDNCGASYRSAEAALSCCSDEFDDDQDDNDGLSPVATDPHGSVSITSVTNPLSWRPA